MTDSRHADSNDACLERTRSAVLNVLVAAGVGIAISGALLRWRDGWALFRASEDVRRGLMLGLIGLAIASILVRRTLASRNALRDPAGRAVRFYRGHVLAASLAALAVPLGLAYGWIDRPRLDAVAPFWIAALALGFLAFPRAHELQDFDDPIPSSAPRESESP